jgi:L-cysteate sulfo-lyase
MGNRRRSMVDPLKSIRSFSRLQLAHLPTPLEPMPRLGRALGIESLWVKRDDCTGLGFGGNKVRKLEFSLATALANKADCVVCGGVAQSNTARQVAAACAKLGIECHLGIMHGRVANPEPVYQTTGNILLGRLYGAIVHEIPWTEDRNLGLQGIASALQSSGRRVHLIPYGASDAIGAMGYILAAEEIVRQCPSVGWIAHASGSAGTQAGLLAGLLALGYSTRVIGIDVDAQADRVRRDVKRVGYEVASFLEVQDRWAEGRVKVFGEWSGPAYGEPDASTDEAILMAARLEGLALDPVYTGKGMAGLIGLARKGWFKDGAPVVWIHTGGSPGIFAYPQRVARLASEVSSKK